MPHTDRELRKLEDRIMKIKYGDWICGSCGQHNYRDKKECFVCTESSHEGVARKELYELPKVFFNLRHVIGGREYVALVELGYLCRERVSPNNFVFLSLII